MIKLSDRLQAIADNIGTLETMADIGTDHGFLPIYLRETGKCSRVILTDVSEASLAKAGENYRKFAQELCDGNMKNGRQSAATGFQFRVGDGLSVLKPFEVDTIVIAGMGGRLIKSLLEKDFQHTCSYRKFILQPRVGQGELRKWLCDHNFAIVSEDMVKEGDYIPEIITALSPSPESSLNLSAGLSVNNNNASREMFYQRKYKNMVEDYREQISAHARDDIFFEVPPWIIDATGPVEEFLNRNIEKEKSILKNVMLSKKRAYEREERICNRIYYLKNLLKEYRDGK